MNSYHPQRDEGAMAMGGDPAGYACRNRIVEWQCTLILLCLGATAAIWPESITNTQSAFKYLQSLSITPFFFSWTCLFIGSVRFAALYFNGRGLPLSARIRAAGAIFGAVVFAHLAWSLAFLYKDRHSLSLSVCVFVILSGVEVYSTLRAGADVNDKAGKARSDGPNRTIVARIITRDTSESGPSGLGAVRPPDAP
jgi:L-asparagine transporter-like permease